MNDSTTQTHEDPQGAHDPHDTLVDRLLAEAIGDETPPDQSEAILCRLEESPRELASARQERAGRPAWSRIPASAMVLAAMALLTVSFAVLLLPEVRGVRNGGRPDELALHASPAEAPEPMPESELRYQEETREGDESLLVEAPSGGAALGLQPLMGLDGDAARAPQPAPTAPEAKFQMFSEINSSEISSREGLLARVEDGRPAAPVLGKPPELASGPRPEFHTLRLGRAQAPASAAPATSAEPFAQPPQRFRVIESDSGIGPGESGDRYSRIDENPFVIVKGRDALSTFSIDVDTASYANVRQFLLQSNQLPPRDAVRIEELVNYFDYGYEGPSDDAAAPFSAAMEVASCPWAPTHRLVRVALKGREVERDARPPSNLVFLVDVSGSMNRPNKLPLVVSGLRKLTEELGENDRVAIVVYASSEGLVCPSTPCGDHRKILASLDKLRAGGSTAGGAGIRLAYQIAEEHKIPEGVNRVILCTDGDFNVGTTSTAELERLVEQKAKESGVFLSVLGFGRGNLNDAMMEAVSNRGNGNYAYIDSERESHKVLVKQVAGTLVTIAKDVKIQVEFNPARVAGYRLLGYENRALRAEDFNDDKKDAGEIGAGHAVTALYEVVPAGLPVAAGGVDALKYQRGDRPERVAIESGREQSGDMLTLKLRYKRPDGDTSTKLEFPLTDTDRGFAEATSDFRFASAVASFGMLLRDSEHRGSATHETVLEIAASSLGADPHGYRAEFLEVVRKAQALSGE